MDQLIPLTSSLKINPGSHVLYFYNELNSYIDNVCAYILDGMNLGQQIVLIDSFERYQLVLERIGPVDKNKIHYVNNYEFYEMYQDFHFERVLHNLNEVVNPYAQNEETIRIWGHVDWKDQEGILPKLHTYECNCDITVAAKGYTTVCSYESGRVPSNILLELLKSHEYIMTDENLSRSSLYKSSTKNNDTVFPSLSIQTKIESEVDLYKQKLDFVHVVSHEVRNPLTVIKAYAALLEEEEQDEERRSRLREIINYSVVIDNEISHIINTEQMLSTDALWQKQLIEVTQAIIEVIDIMDIKARTQGIQLIVDIECDGKEHLLVTKMGLKLIISNLLSNAIKYSVEGNEVKLGISVKEGFLMITVKDKGVGMTSDQLQKLFKKYEKIDHEHSGQGIGLFMVKKLVDHFGGTIKVESEIFVGTTFEVSLPLYK